MFGSTKKKKRGPATLPPNKIGELLASSTKTFKRHSSNPRLSLPALPPAQETEAHEDPTDRQTDSEDEARAAG